MGRRSGGGLSPTRRGGVRGPCDDAGDAGLAQLHHLRARTGVDPHGRTAASSRSAPRPTSCTRRSTTSSSTASSTRSHRPSTRRPSRSMRRSSCSSRPSRRSPCPRSRRLAAAGDRVGVWRSYVHGSLLAGGAATAIALPAWWLSPKVYTLWLGDDLPATRAILPLVLLHTILGTAAGVGRATLVAVGRARRTRSSCCSAGC